MPEMPMPGQPEVPKKKGLELGGLFGGKKKEEKRSDAPDVLGQVIEVSRRIRIIESRYTDLSRKSQVNEKNMLSERKRFTTEIKTLDSETLEIKKEMNELKTKLDMVIAELKNFAGKEDVHAIKKYVELWEPVNFITRDEVDKIIKEAMEENK